MQNQNNQDSGGIYGINVTPLVDIILVLLITFMLTANVIQQANIPVELPQAKTGQTSKESTLVLTMSQNGKLYVNQQLVDEKQLKHYLAEYLKNHPADTAQAMIAADKSVSHGAVVHVIDIVRASGIYKFALNIDPDASAAAPP